MENKTNFQELLEHVLNLLLDYDTTVIAELRKIKAQMEDHATSLNILLQDLQKRTSEGLTEWIFNILDTVEHLNKLGIQTHDEVESLALQIEQIVEDIQASQDTIYKQQIQLMDNDKQIIAEQNAQKQQMRQLMAVIQEHSEVIDTLTQELQNITKTINSAVQENSDVKEEIEKIKKQIDDLWHFVKEHLPEKPISSKKENVKPFSQIESKEPEAHIQQDQQESEPNSSHLIEKIKEYNISIFGTTEKYKVLHNTDDISNANVLLLNYKDGEKLLQKNVSLPDKMLFVILPYNAKQDLNEKMLLLVYSKRSSFKMVKILYDDLTPEEMLNNIIQSIKHSQIIEQLLDKTHGKPN